LVQNLYALGEAFPLLYIVSYKLFWNRNGVWFDTGKGVVRFDLTLAKGLSIDTFSSTVWYKLCHHDHSVLRVRIIFTINESVDRTRNLKSDASRFKQKNMKKMRRRPDFLWNKMRCRQDLSNKMRRRPDFLTKSQWVICPIDIACNLFFTNHSSKSSSFD